ncbi:PAS domain S-box protein [Mastigocoleus testarum]|uniref:histidine kinase n=1 Tax=Mastigocoleus testarum BC008 TaxID=371196 RepID=A0A0V7ZNX7_9CYAN|nr:PAS domain S-box protein [Mastigocoleus testarum]KST66436.1 hypothetical protein BC008_42650 [Mastigocoleus testarum BC008]
MTDLGNKLGQLIPHKQLEVHNHQVKMEFPQSQQLLQLVMDNIPQSIFWKDCNGVYLGCNRNFARDAGVGEPENIIGKTDYDLPWTCEEAEWYRECDRRVMEEGIPQLHIHETQQQADGKQFWVDTNKIPLRDYQGNIVGILGTYEDITERKQGEESLKKLKNTLEAKIEERTTQLRQVETRLSRITDNLPGMIYQFRLDSDGSVSFPYISSGCREIYGLEPQQVQQNYELLYNCVHPSDFPGLEESILTSALTLEKWEYEWRITTISGQQKWLRGMSKPELQLDGSIVWDGCIVEITKRKKAEAELKELNEKLEARVEERTLELRQSEKRLRTVISYAPIILFALDREARFTFSDGKGLQALGLKSGEVIGVSVYEFYQDFPEILAQIDSAFAGQEVTDVVKVNGIFFESHYSPQRNQAGEIIGVTGLSVDISERKKVEAALKEQIQLSVFRASINSTLIASGNLQHILQHCTELVVKYLDAAFARIWTLNPQENVLELQASAGIYTHINGFHGRVPVGKYKIGLIAQERQPHLTNSVQTDPRVTDKKWAREESMVAFAGYPLIFNHKLVGVIAMFARHELSESVLNELSFVANEISLGISRKQAEIQLHHKANELEKTLHELKHAQAQLIQSEKMSSLGQMVAGVAHEINNPANFIYGNLTHAREYTRDLLGLLELYQKKYPNPPQEIKREIESIELDFLIHDLTKLFRSMEEGTRRIREIVISLRNFSRLDEASFKQVDIHEGIESTLMILQNRLKAKSNRPEIKVFKNYGDLPQVECYPGQLNQVFMNILINAIDSLESDIADNYNHLPEFPSPQIYIQTKKINQNRISVNITDNGAGIEPGIFAKLFDPFFTTKDVGKGTGLGLSISYQIIVDEHGGNLSFESTLGTGASFTIEIPITHSLFRLHSR